MRLNDLQPHPDSKPERKRVGRGMGSGEGKTAGRGHKGQKSRAGGFHKVGFEGGQMPLHRRLPKVGFRSYLARTTAEVRLNELEYVQAEVIDLAALQAANLVSRNIKHAKVIATGSITRPVTLKGIRTSKGARAAIEAAGGKIEA